MLNRDFREIISALNSSGAEYLVVGAYALAAHGLPRATGDLDLWIRSTPENAERVWHALSRFGAPLEQLGIQDFTTRGMVIQFGVEPGRIDFLTTIDGVTFDEAVKERIVVAVDDVEMPVIGRDDLLRNKRAVGRPQDLADIARLEGLE